MSLPTDSAPRKSQPSQSSNGNGNQENANQFDRFQVRDKPRDWEVRLKNKWIKAWFRVLHPLAIQVWCVLKMHALWREGPDHGKTGDWYTKQSLIDLCGTTDRGIRRALAELQFYGLLSYEDPDPQQRSKRGKCCRMVLDDDAPVPSERFRLTHKAISASKHNVGAPTYCQNDHGSHGQNGLGTHGQNDLGSHGQNGLGTHGQNGRPQRSSIKIGESRTESMSSSSSIGTRESKADDDEPTLPPQDRPTQKKDQPPPDVAGQSQPEGLMALRQIIPVHIDDGALRQLVGNCRQVHPDVTMQEIEAFTVDRCMWLKENHARNPVGWLLTAVPNSMAGDGLKVYRDLLQESSRQDAEKHDAWEKEKLAWAAYERGQGPSPMTGRMKRVNGSGTEA
jgi:hypothetical protein